MHPAPALPVVTAHIGRTTDDQSALFLVVAMARQFVADPQPTGARKTSSWALVVRVVTGTHKPATRPHLPAREALPSSLGFSPLLRMPPLRIRSLRLDPRRVHLLDLHLSAVVVVVVVR